MSGPALEFAGLVCGYGDTMVVRGISAAVEAGRVLAVVGRNGVGKSTLLKALAGLLPVTQGRVRRAGADLATVPMHRRLALGIAYAPQDEVVFGDLSVGDNLWLHLRDRDPQRYAAALAQFPLLAQRLGQRAGSLSGGERKILSFTRTLGLRAPVTLLDEPTEGVQPENIERMAALCRARRQDGAAFVIVEQNLEFVAAVADDVLVLDHGEAVLAGRHADLGRPAIERHLVV